MSRPKGILLDIGGTILCAKSYDFSAGIGALDPTDDADQLVVELTTAIDYVHRTNSAEFKIADWLVDKRGRFRREGTITDLEQILYRETFKPTPAPGIREAFEVFDNLGVALGCITNTVFSGLVIRNELRQHHLSGSIRFLISSADASIRKPESEIFTAGVVKLGLEPSEVWFIGDTWGTDIEGAAAAGLLPIWLSKKPKPIRPHVRHIRARSWREISQLVT